VAPPARGRRAHPRALGASERGLRRDRGRVGGIPFSFTAHAYDIYSNDPKLRNETLVWKLRNATQVFAVSDYAADLLREKLAPADRGRVHTVRVGIPMHLFCPEPPRPRDGTLASSASAAGSTRRGSTR
jgi:hypothetical protein